MLDYSRWHPGYLTANMIFCMLELAKDEKQMKNKILLLVKKRMNLIESPQFNDDAAKNLILNIDPDTMVLIGEDGPTHQSVWELACHAQLLKHGCIFFKRFMQTLAQYELQIMHHKLKILLGKDESVRILLKKNNFIFFFFFFLL